jgi:hypothetical protein
MAIYNEEQDPNILGLDTTKEDLISEIKEILEEYGHFNTKKLSNDCSPSIETKGSLIHLVEYFSKGYCEVKVYKNWDDCVDSYYLSYEELNIETLEEILHLCKEWEQINFN